MLIVVGGYGSGDCLFEFSVIIKRISVEMLKAFENAPLCLVFLPIQIGFRQAFKILRSINN